MSRPTPLASCVTTAAWSAPRSSSSSAKRLTGESPPSSPRRRLRAPWRPPFARTCRLRSRCAGPRSARTWSLGIRHEGDAGSGGIFCSNALLPQPSHHRVGLFSLEVTRLNRSAAGSQSGLQADPCVYVSTRRTSTSVSENVGPRPRSAYRDALTTFADRPPGLTDAQYPSGDTITPGRTSSLTCASAWKRPRRCHVPARRWGESSRTARPRARADGRCWRTRNSGMRGSSG